MYNRNTENKQLLAEYSPKGGQFSKKDTILGIFCEPRQYGGSSCT